MLRKSPGIGYSLNVFPDESLEELQTTLRTRAVRIRREAYRDREFPIEMRLSARMVSELRAQPKTVAELRDMLQGEGLRLVTLNAFVPVSFHQPNLKEQVYLPAWCDGDERVRYTCACAELLAELAPPTVAEPSLSVPGGVLKRDFTAPDVHPKTAKAVRRCAEFCADLKRRTGRHVRIGLEPEPGLTYERTPELINFFREFFPGTDSRNHLGVNFDICHQLVEFEDLAASVAALEQAGVAITKIHVSNCIEIARPLIAPELMDALQKRYAESKFLHQICGVDASGSVVYASLDLPEALTPDGVRTMSRLGVEKLRVHYHMPLLSDESMPTSIAEVERFIRGFALANSGVPLVIETYTWLEQIAASTGRHDLMENIAAEIQHVRSWL